MLEDGVIAAQYLESWRTENIDTVLVCPRTYLPVNESPSHCPVLA